MKIIVAQIAQREFNEAKEFYEIEKTGLGLLFEKEIKEATFRIKKFPEAWPVEQKEIRRYILHKFPYKILYTVQDKIILILAFAHRHREPNYWIGRKPL